MISLEKETEEITKEQDVTIVVTEEGSGLPDNTKYEWQLGTSDTKVPDGEWDTYVPGKSQAVGTDLTGTYYIWVKEIKDNAGNESEEQGTKVEDYHVFGPFKFANQEPTVTFTPDGNTTYAQTQQTKVDIKTYGGTQVDTAKYQWTQSSTPPTKESFENAEDLTSGEDISKGEVTGDNWYLWVYVVDTAGNETIKGSNPFYLDNTEPDKTAPSVESISTTITVNFKQNDAHSGIDTETIQYAIRKKGDTEWSEWISDSETHKFIGLEVDTIYEIKTRAKDKAGNGYTESDIIEKEVKKLENASIDHTPKDWTNGNVTVTITYAELPNTTKQYSLDNGVSWIDVKTSDYIESTEEYAKISFIVEENNTTVIARTIDTEGQASKEAIDNIDNIDKEKPIVSIEPNGGTYTLEPGQTMIQEDIVLDAYDIGSGNNKSDLDVLEYAWSDSNTIEPQQWDTFVNGEANTKDLSGGTHYLWTRVIDKATNRADNLKISNPYIVNYKIIYDANGGENAPEPQMKTHNQDLALSSEIPTRNSYKFKGWALNKNSTQVDYQAGSNYIEDKAVTLYAVWELQEFTVTFNPMGGTVDPSSKEVLYNEPYGELPTPTKLGYKFDGWYLEENYQNKVDENTIVNSMQAHTLYANWIANTNTRYRIQHYKQNLTGTGYQLEETENETGTTGTTVTASPKTYEGFTYDSSISGTVQSGVINGDGSLILKLYYKRNSYTLILEAGSYISSVSGSGTYKYGESVTVSATVQSSTSSYTYSFNSWKEGSTIKSYSRSYTFTMPANDLTLTATGSRTQVVRRYTVVYDGNGETSGSMSNSTFTYGTTYTLKANTYTKTGYEFVGWNTEPDGTGTDYYDEERVSNLTSVNGGVVTLYAQWEDNTAPTITASGGNTLWTTTELSDDPSQDDFDTYREFTVRITENGSGVQRIQYVIIPIEEFSSTYEDREQYTSQPTSSQINSGTSIKSITTSSKTYSMTYAEEANGFIFFRTVDNSGNVSSWSTGQRLKIALTSYTSYAGMDGTNDEKPVIYYDANKSRTDLGTSGVMSSSNTKWKNYGVGQKSGSTYKASAYDALMYKNTTRTNLHWSGGYYAVGLRYGEKAYMKTNYNFTLSNKGQTSSNKLNEVTYEVIARPDHVSLDEKQTIYSSMNTYTEDGESRPHGVQLTIPQSNKTLTFAHRYYTGTSSNHTWTSISASKTPSNFVSNSGDGTTGNPGKKRYLIQNTFSVKGKATATMDIDNVNGTLSQRVTKTNSASTDQNLAWGKYTWLGIGCDLNNNNSPQSGDEAWYDGMIYAFRYYERKLTDDELQKNAVLDYDRYTLMSSVY